MSVPFIRCRQLTRIYTRGEERIKPLDQLDLDIDRGRFVALMGPSGSGKTTLLNLLAGIDSPTNGELHVGDTPVHSLSRGRLAAWRADHVGYIFQLYNLVPVLNAYENVELPLLLQSITRTERHRRVSAAMEAVGIGDRHKHYPRQLSGGQEQRVAIARAIVTEPDLLLCDEPTGDLDRETATSIMDLLQRLNRDEGRTIVMVTHDPATTKWADTLLHLEKGRLLEHVENPA
ncbi:MAG: ABC transporter ATP-binding protein [Phycisphaerae bacterium]|nr:ABC transporter ATP-binding protein [Phycisphaerae bacterium]|tara:strand:+ start:6853 stop:7548 length:696 start_codon:yes stop_codon:yes gene_type:complete